MSEKMISWPDEYSAMPIAPVAIIVWFGIFDGTRLICVEENAETARRIARRIGDETRRTYMVEPVEIVRVPTAAP